MGQGWINLNVKKAATILKWTYSFVARLSRPLVIYTVQFCVSVHKQLVLYDTNCLVYRLMTLSVLK